MDRRALLRLAVVPALAAPLLPASAQAWPGRAVRVIVPFPPGGVIDAMTRLIAPGVSELLGQPVVVENRSGAGGTLGTEAARCASGTGTRC